MVLDIPLLAPFIRRLAGKAVPLTSLATKAAIPLIYPAIMGT